MIERRTEYRIKLLDPPTPLLNHANRYVMDGLQCKTAYIHVHQTCTERASEPIGNLENITTDNA